MIKHDTHRFLSPVWIGFYLFLIALTFRIGYVTTLEIEQPFRADAGKYMTVAFNLVNHGIYSHTVPEKKGDKPKSDNFITPGYPFFLTGILYLTDSISSTYQIALLLQALLGALTVMITYFIALKLLPLRGSVVVGVLAAVSPRLLIMSGYLLTETLFAFFLVLSVWIYIFAKDKSSLKYFFLFGVIVAITALTRPMAMLIPLIAAGILLMEKSLSVKRLYCFLAIGFGFGLLWTPWQVWSSHQSAGASNLKIVFAYGSYPDFTYKNPDLRGYPDYDDPEFKNMKNSIPHTLKVLGERASHDPLKYISWYLLEKPVSYWGWTLVQGSGGPFLYPIKRSLYDKSPVAKISLVAMKYIHYVLVFLLFSGFLYTIINIAAKRDLNLYQTTFWVILLILAYTTSVHTVLASIPRYSIPFQYFLYICSIYFFTYFFKEYVNENRFYREFMTKLSIGYKPTLVNKGKTS